MDGCGSATGAKMTNCLTCRDCAENVRGGCGFWIDNENMKGEIRLRGRNDALICAGLTTNMHRVTERGNHADNPANLIVIDI